jgi:hemerythrin-like metal-binding protein
VKQNTIIFGLPEVDRTTRGLLTLTNDLRLAGKGEAVDRALLRDLLERLHDHARVLHHKEDDLMVFVSYDQRASHAREHKAIRDEISSLINLVKGNAQLDAKALRAHLQELIIEHCHTRDRALVRFIEHCNLPMPLDVEREALTRSRTRANRQRSTSQVQFRSRFSKKF